MLEGGKYYKFEVKRKTDLGYMLFDEYGNEVLMFYKEATKELEIGEKISAFIYYDKKGRLCATNKEVFATVNSCGLLEVLSVADNGVYLNNNTAKDVLLSSDYLPQERNLWPQIGDKVGVILKQKRNNLVARIAKKDDLAKKEVSFITGEKVKVYVIDIKEKGLMTYTDDLLPVFIPQIFVRGSYHIGQLLEPHITKIAENISYGSLVLNKEKQMASDEEIILNYLNKHKVMPFTAKSSSVSIENTFKISRKAFKRAYGKLYKEGKIYFDENNTYLKDEK